MTEITVVICTYNRASYLDECLRALSQQVCDAGVYEVIVVDNASTDATQDIARGWASRDRRISYIYEPIQGLARARNTGLRNTKSPFISFTDDDAIVAENWISLMLASFSSLPPSVFAVGGEIDPIFEIARPGWLTDELLRPLSAHLGWSETARLLQGEEWICEVNSTYRTEKLRQYGGFPEELGRQGDLLLSGENYVNEVARRSGDSIYFDPRIRVSHFIPASRLTKDWFRRRFFWQGVTASLLPRIAAARYGLTHDHWHELHVPISPRDWVKMASDEGNDAEFIENCGHIHELGYLLGAMNLIAGR